MNQQPIAQKKQFRTLHKSLHLFHHNRNLSATHYNNNKNTNTKHNNKEKITKNNMNMNNNKNNHNQNNNNNNDNNNLNNYNDHNMQLPDTTLLTMNPTGLSHTGLAVNNNNKSKRVKTQYVQSDSSRVKPSLNSYNQLEKMKSYYKRSNTYNNNSNNTNSNNNKSARSKTGITGQQHQLKRKGQQIQNNNRMLTETVDNSCFNHNSNININLSRFGDANKKNSQHNSYHNFIANEDKSIEDLLDQNYTLKKLLNQVKEENALLKNKTNFHKKQNEKLSKEMFLENQYYYEGFDLAQKSAGNKFKIQNKHGFHPVGYMITGIKYRYQVLKEKYDKKCQQIQTMLKKTNYSSIQQLTAHISILQKQNQHLINQIQTIKSVNSVEPYTDGNCFKSSKFISLEEEAEDSIKKQYEGLIFVQNQLKQKLEKLTLRNEQINAKTQKLQMQLKDKSLTIEKIQKALRIADNDVYHKKKQINKVIKLKKQTEEEIKQIKLLNAQIQVECKGQIQSSKAHNQKKFNMQKKIFQREMKIKDEKIVKLEKQVSYLSTLLKYWKPLQPQKSQQNQHKQNSNNAAQASGLGLRSSSKGSKSSMLLMNKKRSKTKNSSFTLNNNNYNMNNQNERVQEFRLDLKDPSKSGMVSQYDSQIQIDSDNVIGQREPMTSRKKNTLNSFKARKINPLEIQYLKQPIKNRCYIRRLTIDSIKSFFEINQEEVKFLSKKQQLWNRKYINMLQIKNTLKQKPFSLNSQESQKLSRYIVEDTSAQHVYCDDTNQIQRQIVKSIVKAFLGNYQLPDLEKSSLQFKAMMNQYGKNMHLALGTLASDGKISSEKLFGLMESLGIEFSEDLRSAIVSKLFSIGQQIQSNRNINTLGYAPMFKEGFL